MIKNKAISILYKLIIVVIGGYGLFINFWKITGEFDIELLYYFTDLSNILVFIYFIIDIIYIIRKNKTAAPRFKGAVTMAITVTFLIYNFLLRPHDFVMGSDKSNNYYIKNTILHYIVPIMTILDWIIFDKKCVYRIIDPIFWLIMPLVYFVFTLIRAQIGPKFSDGSRYPYFFIDIDKYGINTVMKNVILLTMFFLLLGYIIYFIDRIICKLKKE